MSVRTCFLAHISHAPSSLTIAVNSAISDFLIGGMACPGGICDSAALISNRSPAAGRNEFREERPTPRRPMTDISPSAGQASPADAHAHPDAATFHPVELDIESLTALVQDFYADVLKHPLLGPVFRKEIGANWDAHLRRMVDFWSTVMLGTRQFRGNLVHRHMQLQGVSPAHFSAWIQLWTLHTSERFDSATTYKLRRVAHDIGRQLFVSYFDDKAANEAAR